MLQLQRYLLTIHINSVYACASLKQQGCHVPVTRLACHMQRCLKDGLQSARRHRQQQAINPNRDDCGMHSSKRSRALTDTQLSSSILM